MGSVKSCLLQQFEISWQLLSYHLTDLGTEECLWRPNAHGLHVHQNNQGHWIADWPEQEGYSLGPSSIAWTSWHILFWWSMTLNHSFSDGRLSKEAVFWPGSGKATCEEIHRRRHEWIQLIEGLSDADLESSTRTRWPLQDRPFTDVIACLNIELAKNAAEIGYARFLYACRHPARAKGSGLQYSKNKHHSRRTGGARQTNGIWPSSHQVPVQKKGRTEAC